MISVQNVVKHFGGIVAVDGVSMKIERGSITGLIGPNGAGKTTLFNLIAGNITPNSGSIFLDDEDVTGLKPHELFSKGLLRTFQIAHEFHTLSVLDNLMMVPPLQTGTWFRRKEVVRQEAEIRKKAEDVISFLNMGHVSTELAGNLSGGQKKLLELGRTMMVDPKVVVLDEVGAGVNRTLLREVGDAILSMNRDRGYTFCMIEHGTAEEIKSNEDVIEAYLGTGLKNKGEVLPG